jgi:hypothetical protein
MGRAQEAPEDVPEVQVFPQVGGEREEVGYCCENGPRDRYGPSRLSSGSQRKFYR